MRPLYFAPILLILLCFNISIAQETLTYGNSNKTYLDALDLYHNQLYQASQVLFLEAAEKSDDSEIQSNSEYYYANAAVRLGQRGADRLMEDFVETHPTSAKTSAAYKDVADYYFDTGKFPNALKWYKKAEGYGMSRAEREKTDFNMGYAYYTTNRPKDAERYLKRVENSQEYGSQAKYYLGYIAYEQDDYEGANRNFDEITDPEVLEEKLSYYQADLNFKLGNFEEAIKLAKKQIPKSNRREVSELNKIIGESYFNLGQYGNAIPHLEKYQGKRGKWSNTDHYLLGYSHYKESDYQNAIGQFNKIIDGKNAVAQNAYYHLAECYLKLGKKTEALNAFRNASQMDFSEDIQRDAYLNYARLGYDVGNPYEPVDVVLEGFLKKYPKDDNVPEVQRLLVDSFISAKNYKGAMDLLRENPDYASKDTYQKVAFYYGVDLFKEDKYEEALDAFKKSLRSNANKEVTAQAKYWEAETNYRLNRFDEALGGFKEFQRNTAGRQLNEYQLLDYNLGYSHFKLKDYSNAIAAFERAGDQNNLVDRLQGDALLRLGDCYFGVSRYSDAKNAYQRAKRAATNENGYASYQMAMCDGFLGNGNQKIEGLIGFIRQYPKSNLQDDAYLELANTYVKNGQESQGMETYSNLRREFPNSKFVPQSLLRQGLVYYNGGENQRALTHLKQVVDKYPKSPEAVQAVNSAKLIYVDMGRADEYAEWARNVDIVDVSDAELDEASFESAERKAASGSADQSIRAYENYLRQFPDGLYAMNANFKLAQLHSSKNDNQKALPYYLKVHEAGNTEYSEEALTRISDIYMAEGAFNDALPYLKELERSAGIDENRTFAQSNLMKGYYEREDYEKTLDYAQKVLRVGNIDDRIKSDAQIMVARSALKTGDYPLAEEYFGKVKEIGTHEVGAEAWYYDAYFKNGKKDYEASNESVQKLAQDFSSYKEWAGKGLLLMSNNYYELDDAFQATYILESVIENFSDYPAIVKKAERELAAIKKKEAAVNSSIDPNN